MPQKIVKVLKTEDAVINELCKLIEERAKLAIEQEEVFKVGLSGYFLCTHPTKSYFAWFSNASDFSLLV